MAERNFVKMTFLKLEPGWRRRAPEERAPDKREFAAACHDIAALRFERRGISAR